MATRSLKRSLDCSNLLTRVAVLGMNFGSCLFFYCLSATEIRHSYPCRFLFIDAETVVRRYGKFLVHVFLGARCAKTRRAVIGKKYPPPGKKWAAQ